MSTLSTKRGGALPEIRIASASVLLCAALCPSCAAHREPAGPYAAEVVSVTYGAGAGFGQDAMPEVVLGPPEGAGDRAGSLDVVSLGVGGEIVLRLRETALDGPGADLAVFENAFWVSGDMRNPYAEPAFVAVSADGASWSEFACTPEPPEYAGCAGIAPVYASERGPSALDPTVSGGDLFDLATIGAYRARFVRIRDAGRGPAAAPAAGFDLDAVAVLHPERPTPH